MQLSIDGGVLAISRRKTILNDHPEYVLSSIMICVACRLRFLVSF
jgi:hypothetical protein